MQFNLSHGVKCLAIAGGEATQPRRLLRGRFAMLAALAALLAGCASTPLPTWPTNGSSTAGSRSIDAAVPAPRRENLPITSAAGAPSTPGAVTSPINAQRIMPAPYSPAVAARFPDLTTTYATPGLQASRARFTTNAEIQSWLAALAAPASRNKKVNLSILSLGISQAGENLTGVVLTHETAGDALTLAQSKKPTVLIIAQQHGNEPASAEAALVVARELAVGLLEPLLDRINVVIVPRANPDGAAMQTRTAADGTDMNYDHLLLITPEAQALARLVRNYRPFVVLDAQEYSPLDGYSEKFGAIARFDVLLHYATTPNLHEFINKTAEEWYRRPLAEALESQGLSNEWQHQPSTQPGNKQIMAGSAQPDTWGNVNGLKNTVSLTVQTRGAGMGYTHIQRRVHSQVVAMSSVLRSTAERADNLLQVRSYVERDDSARSCRGTAVLDAAPALSRRSLVMLDPTTGADRMVSVEWASSLQFIAAKSRSRPCGYWIDANAALAVERLQLLGLNVMRVAESGTLLAENYRSKSRGGALYEDVRGTVTAGDLPVKVVGVELVRGAIDVPPGSYYIPLNQPLAHIAIAALEPDTSNSFFTNRLLAELGSVARVMAPPSIVMEEAP